MNYTVRNLGIQDTKAIADLYRSAFNKEPNIDVFKWKYFESPAGHANLIGIIANDEIVGSGALLPERMSVFGEIKTVYKCTDLMVDPNHRKKGLAKMIIDSLKETITVDGRMELSYTMCSKVATYGFVKNNYQKLSDIYYYFKPLLLLKIGKPFNNSAKFYKQGILKKYDVIPDELNSFSFRNSSEKIEINKSVDFLRWRIKNPKFNYNTICIFEEGDVVGYLIFGTGDSRVLNIIDFEVLNSDTKLLKMILQAAQFEAVQRSCKGIIGMSIVHGSWAGTLKKFGFLVNSFSKGPLSSILDFNVLVDHNNPEIMKDQCWEINSMNYDDI